MHPNNTHTYAASELQRVAALYQDGAEAPEALVRLYELAQLLLEHPLISAAVEASSGPASVIPEAEFQDKLSEWFAAQMQKPIVNCIQDAARLMGHNGFEQGPMDVFKTHPVTWLGKQTTSNNAVAWLRDNPDWTQLRRHEQSLIQRYLLDQLFNALIDIHPANDVATIQNQIVAINNDIGRLLEQMEVLESTHRVSDQHTTLRRLRTFSDAMKGVRLGDLRGASVLTNIEDNCYTLRFTVRRIVDTTLARLAREPVQAHVLDRLKITFEQHENEELVAACAKAPSAEKVLQKRLNKFVFQEGLFGITHAEAGKGKFDTFIDTFRDLSAQAIANHQPAILIELKQGLHSARLDRGITKAEMETLLKEALDQADEYSAHVRTNRAWRDHQVFTVVVYDGPKRYVPKDHRVRMIYLGSAPPSDGATFLDV